MEEETEERERVRQKGEQASEGRREYQKRVEGKGRKEKTEEG